jgi:hypothetical protein
MHPNTLLYESFNSFSSICASCCVSNLRRSFKNVNPSLPVRISGFSILLQIVVFGSAGGMTSADMLLLEATIPAATAAATTTLTETVTVVDGSVPNGPTGATTAAPPALTPAAHEDAAF